MNATFVDKGHGVKLHARTLLAAWLPGDVLNACKNFIGEHPSWKDGEVVYQFVMAHADYYDELIKKVNKIETVSTGMASRYARYLLAGEYLCEAWELE